MRMRTLTLVLASLVMGRFAFHSRAADPTPTPQTLTIVQWNVENLFDTDDDPANPGDDEYLPGSWRRWTRRRRCTVPWCWLRRRRRHRRSL